MEIGENAEAKIHSVQSVPIFSSASESSQEKQSGNIVRKISKNRRVSFASSTQLAQYLEPINPFNTLVPISSSKELSNLYRRSCEKHSTIPLPSIIQHLEAINLESSTSIRADVLNLRNETLSHESCEALEELFKRVKYRVIDLTSCSLDDVSATAIFDMIEYYEACNELNISENYNIKNRGWQSCINMIKRSQALHSLFTRGTPLSDANALALGNALLTSYIYTLKLEHCGLTGRPILCLSGALQKNKTLKELCLANNELNHNDAFHIGNVLKNNYHLQLLDISNNDIQDEGFRHIAEALGYQSVHVNKTSSGDSLRSASIKFDFSDLTANLNNINNNRQRFCPTPPPKIHIADDGASSLNNNSILECDNDKKSAADEPKSDVVVIDKSEQNVGKEETEPNAVAIMSTKSAKSEDIAMREKFKYTTASLSPISSGYDDTTTNHQLFNARSPERSFSSESLCSEASNESNDSKDSKNSIRLIETKFNSKNGTLERQLSSAPPTLSSNEKQPTGLQVLILWNNSLSAKCAPSCAEMLESTEHLQIVNFGQNPIGNNFLLELKSSLKTNNCLTSLGLQATQLTCDGLKILGEILQFGGNSTLQRIDLRNNELSVAGLSALSDALKSNKSIIRVDLDAEPKNSLENGSEYQIWLSTIRQQCAHNENPPEPLEAAKATTVQRIRGNHLTTRKISLTCSNFIPKQLLEPSKKPSGRLHSPSPISSPASSPLPSPSRNRFQVSRVSESSSGVSSKLTSSTSPSPSSSSGSPTFFPSNSRFRVIQVTEAPKFFVSPVTSQVTSPASLVKTEQSKEIDIPIKTSASDPAKFVQPTAFLDISSSSLLSSQSCDQLDYEVKSFIDIDSSSSFSSSIDSIDHQTDMSSTESFEMNEKSPVIVPMKSFEPEKSDDVHDDDKKDIFSNESTLVSTSSSSSSNEGLTLTTNSPTSELSPKQDAQKRVRKTSWIQTAIGASSKSENYPATLDKLLNLFHHPSSIFTKTSPESTLASSPSGPAAKPKTSQSKDEKVPGMGQKESSFSGFFNSLVSLTHKKEDKLASSDSTTILQNISPENTADKSQPTSHLFLESLPASVKQELKENISPENTISSENLAENEKQRASVPKVMFTVGEGEGSLDLPDPPQESSSIDDDDTLVDDDDLVEGRSSLGDVTRDSMSILKAKSSDRTDSADSNQ